MAYTAFDYCLRLYPSITEEEFDLYSWESGHEMDRFTTGVDGVKKLKIAFPTDKDDAEAVKRCFCELIYTLVQIAKEKEQLIYAGGTQVLNGRVVPNSVSSISSGSESISFAGNVERSQYYRSAVDSAEKDKIMYSIVKKYLSGVCDANGVNLLYGGKYPCGIRR